MIIVQNSPEINHKKLLLSLGFKNLIKLDDEDFEVTIYPDEDKVYIAQHKNNLLICAPDIPMHFFEDELSDIENILITQFPHTEICALILQSVVNQWGYSIIKNGVKIRARAGSSKDGTFVEFGEPLKEESNLLHQSYINEDGEKLYRIHNDKESYTEDQAGENFVFAIFERYFGHSLDKVDESLDNLVLNAYTFGKGKKNNFFNWILGR